MDSERNGDAEIWTQYHLTEKAVLIPTHVVVTEIFKSLYWFHSL